MTTNTYEISGMTCQACVKRVQTALAPFAEHVDVSLNPGQAVLHQSNANLSQFVTALANSHYSISEMAAPSAAIPKLAAVAHAKLPTSLKAPSPSAADIQTSLGWFATYRPLLLILVYLLVASVLVQFSKNGWNDVLWHETMRYFMAGFFLVFSFFKLLDIKAFADAYAGYDLLAKRWRGWGLIYPFVELALGLAYLANWNPLLTNWVTLIVMGFSAIGVIQAVLDKRSIRCACLGTVFKLPMSTITIIEDVGMAVMAAYMLSSI
jgi:copper chaperone CopZ